MSRIAAGTAAAAVEYAVITVGAILTAPILLSSLGLSRLGVFVLLMMLTPARSLSIADLGMEGVLLARLAGAQASGADRERRAVLARGVSFYVIVGTLVATLCATIRGPLSDWLTRTDPAIVFEVDAALGVLSVLLFVQFLAVPFAAHGMGAGSFEITKLLDSVFVGLQYVGVAIAAASGSELHVIMRVPLVLATARLLTHGGRALRFEGASSFNWRDRPSSGLAREASALFVTRMTGLVYSNIDQLLVLKFLTPAHLAKYDLASKPALLLRSSSSIASSTLVRETAHADAVGGNPAAKRLVLNMSRYLGVLMLPVFALCLSQLPFLYRLWLGSPPTQVVTLGRLFLLIMLFLPFAAIASTAMVGLRRVSTTVWAQLLGLGANVSVSIALISRVGVAGVVYGTIVGEAISMAGYVWIVRRMDGEVPRAERLTLQLVYPLGGAGCLLQIAPRAILGDGWTSFLIAVGVAGVNLMLMCRFCLTKEERLTVRGGARRVVGRMSR